MGMKTAIRSALWKILGDPPNAVRPRVGPWDYSVDTMMPRRHAIDMAVANIQISTRNEVNGSDNGSPDRLRGDYLEFGVFQGAMFTHAFHKAHDLIPSMRFFAFDSFQGLPELSQVDLGGEFSEGQFCCSSEDFVRNLRLARVDMARVIIREGWFDDSLTDEFKAANNLTTASIVYLDCDLYESTLPVVRFLTDIVKQGTILLVDDWFHFRADPNRGVRKAVDEWLVDNPQLTLQPWFAFSHHGMAFIIGIRR